RIIDSLQESLSLFLLRNVEKKFPHDHAVPRLVLLEIANIFKPFFPNLFACQFGRQLLFRQKFGMHPDDEHFFVITAIKNSDVSTIWQAFHAAPEIIVIKIIGRGGLDRKSTRLNSSHLVRSYAVF